MPMFVIKPNAGRLTCQLTRPTPILEIQGGMSVSVGSIRFEYNEERDVVVVHPRWNIETEADCKVWLQQYVDYFGKFGRKVDAVFVLDEFKLGRGIGTVWGNYRAELHRRFTRHSVRVHSNAKVLSFLSTSSVLHNVSADEARDIDTALQLIELKRQQPGA